MIHYIQQFNIETITAFAFVMFIVIVKLNITYRVKIWLGLSVSKMIKPFDCYPCLSFWLTLLLTFNPFTAMAVYLISLIINKDEK